MSEETMPNLLRALCHRPDAQALIRGSERFSGLSDFVKFYQTGRGVLVYAEVSGLPQSVEACGNGFFAFHIQSDRQCSGSREDPIAYALSHYNPEEYPHPAHAGDLPPLLAGNGNAL